jgi:hypothetical protein
MLKPIRRVGVPGGHPVLINCNCLIESFRAVIDLVPEAFCPESVPRAGHK